MNLKNISRLRIHSSQTSSRLICFFSSYLSEKTKLQNKFTTCFMHSMTPKEWNYEIPMYYESPCEWYLSECTHTWHLEHDTERRLNKDASCDLVMQKLTEKKNSSLWRRKKKRISEAFFETLSLQISTALSFRVLQAHARRQGNGRGWESSIGRFALGHLFASLHVVATVTAGASVSVGRFFWFLYGFAVGSGVCFPSVHRSQRTPCPCCGTVYRNSREIEDEWRPTIKDVGLKASQASAVYNYWILC